MSPYAKEKFTKKDGRTYYKDATYRSRIGIDVSHHQGQIDWQQVKADGIEFAFIRIGYRGYGEEGSLKEDTEALRNIENAGKAGVEVGVYFFSQAVNEEEAVEEADFVLKALQGKKLELPVVFDPENILDDDARTDYVSKEQFTQNAIAFCEKIKETGYTPAVYCNMMWEAYKLDLSKLESYDIWYADYEATP
ncbi:MAG: lysozyme, partial [Lachnospiraceae bacterium]|nr:lysozyme [Lachnospiraceae bacterium]